MATVSMPSPMTSGPSFSIARLPRAVAALLALAGVLLLGGCGDEQGDQRVPELAPEEAPVREGIKIGAVWSSSGRGSSYAAEQAAGAQLAVKEVNRERALDRPLRLVARDDGSQPERSAQAFTELAERERVAALLGPTLSNSALVADRVAQRQRVPVVAVSNTVAGLTEIGDYVFRASLPESVVQPEAVAVSKEELRYRTAGIISATGDTYSTSGARLFRDLLRDRDVRVVADESFKPGDRTAIERAVRAAAARRPGVLIISALTPDVVEVMRTARRTPGLKRVPFLGGNSFNAPALPREAGSAAEGAVSGAAWISGEDTPGNAEFERAFRERFGRAPDQFAAQAYTGVKLLAEAIRRAGSTDRRLIRSELARIRDFPTALGSFSFDAERNPRYEPVVQVIRDGRRVRLR